MDYFAWLRPLIFRLNEETAHHLAIAGLKYGLVPPQPRRKLPELTTTLWGLTFPNPVGLAAGFDKDGEVAPALLRQGFGFVECGTVVPKPQGGNPKPRLFRLAEDEAIINRFGFNSQGADYFEQTFMSKPRRGLAGINIGKNKESHDAVADYVTLLKRFYGLGDYITINISSPNTPNLRELQTKGPLDELLSAIQSTKAELVKARGIKAPILVKIAPDVTDEDKQYIAEKSLAYGIDGLIISNTTLSRDGLTNTEKSGENGGLSGKPLFAPSTQVLKDMYRLTDGKIPLIGVGGISSGLDAYTKIRAGASLVQLYSALIYQGFSMVNRINHDLSMLLKRDGFSHIREAIGADVPLSAS